MEWLLLIPIVAIVMFFVIMGLAVKPMKTPRAPLFDVESEPASEATPETATAIAGGEPPVIPKKNGLSIKKMMLQAAVSDPFSRPKKPRGKRKKYRVR